MTTTTTTGTAPGALFRHNVISLFAAGFIATLVFHQAAWAILHALGLFPPAPFPYDATWPLKVPLIWSLAFWAGIWGIVYGAVEQRFPAGGMYWVMAFLFGAIVPTAVLLFIVFPMKGMPMAAGWNPTIIADLVVIHGVWGLGMALLLKWWP